MCRVKSALGQKLSQNGTATLSAQCQDRTFARRSRRPVGPPKRSSNRKWHLGGEAPSEAALIHVSLNPHERLSMLIVAINASM